MKAFIDKIKEVLSKNGMKYNIIIAVAFLATLDFSGYFAESIKMKLSPQYQKISELKEVSKEVKEFDLKTEISKTKEVFLIEDKIENTVDIYFKKNNGEVALVKKVPFYSVVRNYEKVFIDKEMNYKWVVIPEKPTLVITSFIFSSQFIFFMFIIIASYFLMEASGMKIFENRFEVLFPKDVKGSMKDIIGYEDVKEEIGQLKSLIRNRKKYKKYGILEVFNVLLTGKAGTGKSKMAAYISRSLNIPMIITTGNVDDKYVGSGVSHIKAIFAEANKIASEDEDKSCIIFIDEGEGLLAKRGQYDNKWADDSTKELLAHLDGAKTNKKNNIIVIVASNFNEHTMSIDSAMSRRFKKKIHFRDPNFQERKNILKHYLKKASHKSKNIDFDFIAKNTSGLTPAIIETITQEAGLIALRGKEKINTENIMKAFENVLIGQSDRKTTKDKENLRRLISIHEIGHFIVGFDSLMKKHNNDIKKVKKETKLLKISSEAIARNNALGYVLSENENLILETVGELEERILSLYGGVAAEEVFYGADGTTTGSADDIEKVTAILNHLFIETSSYSKAKINYSKFESDKIIETKIKEMEQKSSEIYDKSIKIIQNNKKLIEKLSAVLLKKWSLSKDEVFEEIVKFKEAHQS